MGQYKIFYFSFAVIFLFISLIGLNLVFNQTVEACDGIEIDVTLIKGEAVFDWPPCGGQGDCVRVKACIPNPFRK